MADRPSLVEEGLDAIDAVYGEEAGSLVRSLLDASNGEAAGGVTSDGRPFQDLDAAIRCPGCRSNPAPIIRSGGEWQCVHCGSTEVGPES